MTRVFSLAFVLVFVVTATRVQAGFIAYTDRTEFLNAASGAGLTTTNENFSFDPGDPFTIHDSDGNSAGFDLTAGIYSGIFDSLLGGGSGNNSPVVLEGTSVTGSVVGIGFDIAYHSSSNGVVQSMSLNDSSATISSPIGETVSFLGLLSTDGMMISSVDEIRLNSSLNNAPRLDNLVIATGTANPVPEPSTLALLGIGSLGLIGCRRRRNKTTKLAA